MKEIIVTSILVVCFPFVVYLTMLLGSYGYHRGKSMSEQRNPRSVSDEEEQRA
jgi:hypothetical protein